MEYEGHGRPEFFVRDNGAGFGMALILPVEDNPDDEELTMRASKKNNIANEVVVARDDAAAIDCDLGANSHVRKPVDCLEFSETVRQLGLSWLVLNVPAPR